VAGYGRGYHLLNVTARPRPRLTPKLRRHILFIYRNALKNLLRNRGRNILVSVILLIVMTATTVSLSVSAISSKMIENYKDSFGVETSIMVDWKYAQANAQKATTANPDGSLSGNTGDATIDPATIPLDQYVAFADSTYVKSTAFNVTANYASDQLQPTKPKSAYFSGSLDDLLKIYKASSREEVVKMLGGGPDAENYVDSLTDAKPNSVGQVWAYSDASTIKDFQQDEKQLTEGRMFENPGEVLMSTKLASLNNIKLGDAIHISGNSKTHDNTTVDLTVVGIFEDLKGDVSTDPNNISAGADDLFTSFDTLYNAHFYRVSLDKMTFFLTNPDATGPFLQELRDKGLPETFVPYYDLKSYNAIVDPVKKMSGIAVTFGIVVLITGAAILVFLSISNIRERKYEVGVLRSIGMKKHQLARGMVYESLSLVIVFTVIAVLLGGVLARPIAGMLLGTADGVKSVALFTLGPLPLVLLVAAALGVVSSLVGILYVTRYEPMRILQDRN